MEDRRSERHGTANPIRVPEPRYRCAGEYCPDPGYAHKADELFLLTSVLWPGFFCAACRPAPMDLGQPRTEPTTLSRFLASDWRNGDQQSTTETEASPDNHTMF